MKNFSQVLTKHWTLLWLTASLAAAAGTIAVLADYTGVHSVKRVVSTQKPSSALLFSSNSLKSGSSISFAQKLASQIYDITVCNYEQTQAAQPNIANITYELTASLFVRVNGAFAQFSSLSPQKQAAYIHEIRKNSEDATDTYSSLASDDDYKNYVSAWLGRRSYTIELHSNDDPADSMDILNAVNLAAATGYTCTQVFHLKQNVLSTDVFRITFDAQELADGHTEPDFYIKVLARPTEPEGIEQIHNYYCAAKPVSEASLWSGSLLETDCETVDYDFYNYILTGSGKGTIDLKWDSTMLEINPFFTQMEAENIKNPSETTVNGHTWKTITLSVDSTQTNRYNIQFYKISSDTASYTGANAASNLIECANFKKTDTTDTNNNG